MTPDEIEKVIAEQGMERTLAATCEVDLSTFVREAWPWTVPGAEYQHNWHIDAICEHLTAIYELKIRRLLINVPPRFGKPESVDVLVLMGDGSQKRLGDVVVGDMVISHTGRASRVTAVHEQGVLPVVRVLLHSGRSVVAGLDHPFLTPTGWIAAAKLDGHTCANVVPQIAGSTNRTEHEFWLAGYLAGDGIVAYNSLGLAAKDSGIRADFTRRAEAMGWHVRATTNSLHASRGSADWLRGSGVSGTSYTKRVPSWVFTSPSTMIAAFLAGYFMTDGTVDARGRPSVDSVSEGLIRDVQHLLLRFGIRSVLRRHLGAVGERKVRQVGIRYVSWRLRIDDADATARFAESIPLFGYKAERLRGVRSKFDRKLLEDPVVSVEPYGETDCRCLTVENDETFTGNDIVVHNSSLCSVMFPAWLWLQDPKLRLLYSSYAQDLSIRDSLATRRLIDHRWYQERWGSKFSIALDQNEKGRFENNYKGYRLATSVGGQNTGEGGDILVCDDPHNVQEAESELKREGTVRWWNEVMSTRSNDPRTDRRVVIAQRAHFSDLSQDILDKGNYVHLNLPMEFEASISIPSGLVFEEAETKDPRKDDGALLWADRFDEGWVKQQKINMGMYAYASQMQQRPSPREGGMFKRDKIQFDTIPAEMRLDKGKDDAVWSWDCAFKDLEDSNFVVGQCWIRQGGNFYLLHQVRARMSFTATKKAIRACAQKWPTITRILVEDKANGTAVIDDLKNTIPGLWPVEPEGGKVSRASVVEPVWEAGNLFLPMNAPWAEDFIEECCEFDKGAYDDQVDAMSQALVYLLKRMYLPSAAEVTNITRSTLGFHKAKPYHDPRGD